MRGDISLAPLVGGHAAAMSRWMDDPEVRNNVGLRREPSLERTVAWISAAQLDPSIRPFAILCDGAHVGNVILDRIDDHLRTARLSIYIGDAHARGAGIGRAAAWLALREAFDSLGMHKVWLTVHPRNTAALKTYAALGFKTEGVLRGEFILDGERLDALYLGVLRQELTQPS